MFRPVLIECRYGVFARLARSPGCFPPPEAIHVRSDFTGFGVCGNGRKVASRQYGAFLAEHGLSIGDTIAEWSTFGKPSSLHTGL
jgi:hypothetical protein